MMLLCLLLSLRVQASQHYENSFQRQPAVSWLTALRLLSSSEIVQATNEPLIRSRAGAPHFSFVPDVFFRADNLHLLGPPWWADRGPPDEYRDSLVNCWDDGHNGQPRTGDNRTLYPG
jgi:hypothetical protein